MQGGKQIVLGKHYSAAPPSNDWLLANALTNAQKLITEGDAECTRSFHASTMLGVAFCD